MPGRGQHYLGWTELHEKLKEMVSGGGKIAMQYSPMNNIPYVATVDAGTIELVRSFGAEVVSSADLVQQFEAVTDEAGRAKVCKRTWGPRGGGQVLYLTSEGENLEEQTGRESFLER